MVNADVRVCAAPDVFAREFDGELVIVHLERGDYFGLNEIGSRAWESLSTGSTPREIASVLASEYDADPSVIEADLVQLVRELLEHGLVVDRR